MDRLLEREGELAAVGALVDEVVDGRGGLVLVEGDAGIGKTAVVAVARDPARRRGVTVTAARGAELAVARALFVGEKTVETHLGHAYRKLGITARSQLAAALGEGGPLRPRAAGTRR